MEIIPSRHKLAVRTLDLGRLEWGAGSFREFIDNFEELLGDDESPLYSYRTETTGRQAGNARYRMYLLMLATLRGELRPEQARESGWDPESDESLWSHLASLHEHCPALIQGGYRSLELHHGDVFGYVRETSVQRMLVLLNFSPVSTVAPLSVNVGKWVAGTRLVMGDGLEPEAEVELCGHEGRMYEYRRRASV
jgi:hypothetical protein